MWRNYEKVRRKSQLKKKTHRKGSCDSCDFLSKHTCEAQGQGSSGRCQEHTNAAGTAGENQKTTTVEKEGKNTVVG